MPIDAENFHEQALRDKNSTPVLLILDRATGKIYQAGSEGDAAILKVMNYVWDSDTLQPVKMGQPQILADDLTVSMGDVEKLLSGPGMNHYFKRGKNYLDASGNIIYACVNTDIDAAEADTDWLVWKINWNAAGDAIEEFEGPRTGAVDSTPSGLGWNI